MQFTEHPVRRDLAVDTVPAVSVVNGIMHVDFGATRFNMTLPAASGLAAKVADKLAALAKLQTE